jgi:hypothetical protein
MIIELGKVTETTQDASPFIGLDHLGYRAG